MTKTYIVKWKALEFYFLSGEKNFGYGENRNYNGNPYFIHSLMMPTQTTLLGTIRYEILRRLNCLTDYENKNTNSSHSTSSGHSDLIGEKSFTISDKQWNFGLIKKMSPLFIANGNEYIIKAPYHKHYEIDKDKLEYKARNLGLGEYELLDGTNERKLALLTDIKLKKEDEHRSYFYSITNEKLVEKTDLFLTEVRVGINTKEQKDGFFKKEYCRLKPEYEFAVLLELDEYDGLEKSIKENNRSIVYMGMSKSAFSMTIEEVNLTANGFEDCVKESLKMDNINNYSVYYALSDIYVDYWKLSEHCCLILGDSKEFRNLTTNTNSASNSDYYNRFKASDLHYMMNKGSVFFVKNEVEFNKLFENENLNNIGLNKVIKIGGN